MDSESIAYMNIALIKYWCKDKYDPYLKPLVSSISLLAKNLYTKTSIIKNDVDIFILNGEIQDEQETKKIFSFVDKVVPKREKIKIISENTMPTAAGLASSSSAYAALTKELNRFFKLNLEITQMAKISSQGSGSSARSFFEIAAFTKDGDIYEISTKLNLSMIALIVSEEKKKISSRKAMQICKETSPLIEKWKCENEKYFKLAKSALEENDFSTLGELMEKSTNLMHNTMMTSTPSFTYLNETSHKLISCIKNMRNLGYRVYYTLDAGPNVKVLYLKEDEDKVMNYLKKIYKGKIIKC